MSDPYFRMLAEGKIKTNLILGWKRVDEERSTGTLRDGVDSW